MSLIVHSVHALEIHTFVNITMSEVLEENVKHVNEYLEYFFVDHDTPRILYWCAHILENPNVSIFSVCLQNSF